MPSKRFEKRVDNVPVQDEEVRVENVVREVVERPPHDRLDDCVWPDGVQVDRTQWMTLIEAEEFLELSAVYVRRLTQEGRFEGVTRDITGRWWIPNASIVEYRQYLDDKYAKRERKRLGLEKAPYEPPSLRGVHIIKSRVMLDTKLGDSVRIVFLEALDRYERAIEADLRERRGE